MSKDHIQLNLYLESHFKEDLNNLCDGYKQSNGITLSKSQAVAQWIAASKKAGYLIGVDKQQQETTNPSFSVELGEVQEAIAKLTKEMASLKKKPTSSQGRSQKQRQKPPAPPKKLKPQVLAQK